MPAAPRGTLVTWPGLGHGLLPVQATRSTGSRRSSPRSRTAERPRRAEQAAPLAAGRGSRTRPADRAQRRARRPSRSISSRTGSPSRRGSPATPEVARVDLERPRRCDHPMWRPNGRTDPRGLPGGGPAAPSPAGPRRQVRGAAGATASGGRSRTAWATGGCLWTWPCDPGAFAVALCRSDGVRLTSGTPPASRASRRTLQAPLISAIRRCGVRFGRDVRVVAPGQRPVGRDDRRPASAVEATPRHGVRVALLGHRARTGRGRARGRAGGRPRNG